jgi:hypothetical protein
MGTVFFAVLSGAIVYLLLGMLWYGKLFGEAWMQLVGMTKKDIKKARKKGMGTSYAMASLSALVMSYVLYTFMQLVGAGSMLAGINVGLLMWFGFIGTTQLSGVLWENTTGVHLFIFQDSLRLFFYAPISLIICT